VIIDALQQSLSQIAAGHEATRVATTTLLPSGAMASVLVRPAGNGTFFVSDDSAGRKDLLSLGYLDLSGGDRRRGNDIANRLGLLFDGEGFSIREVAADQLTGAIVFVAEAAREWASAAADHAARRVEAALTRRVEDRLRALLPKAKIAREAELTGASTKKYRFDLILELSRDRKAIFESVAPNPSSLSSAHLKLFDLMDAHPDWPREAVTERLEDWSAADVTLLSRVVTHMRAMDQDWRDVPELVH
jgi:hypothetical protein